MKTKIVFHPPPKKCQCLNGCLCEIPISHARTTAVDIVPETEAEWETSGFDYITPPSDPDIPLPPQIPVPVPGAKSTKTTTTAFLGKRSRWAYPYPEEEQPVPQDEDEEEIEDDWDNQWITPASKRLKKI